MSTTRRDLSRLAIWLALGVALPAAEWLRNPGSVWVGLALALAIASGFFAWRQGVRAGVLVGAGLALATALLLAQSRYGRVVQDWRGERERRVSAAYRRLRGELRSTVRRVDRLADRAAGQASGDQGAAFRALARDLPRDGPEMAVAILEPTGVPWAWAGRHRLIPRVEGDSLASRFSRFYAVLESRRHAPDGRVAVATVLIWADSATPRADRSLAARFGASAGVQLRVYRPGAAPRGVEIFDYSEPTTAGDRTFFSIEPVPPDSQVAQGQVLHRVSGWVGWGLLGLLLVGVIVVRTQLEQLGVLALLLWSGLRAPLGAAIGLDDLFSPATFFRGTFRPVTGSAGQLLLTASVILLLAIRLVGRRHPRRAWMIGVGALLLLGAPYLVSELGRGITPPVNGVSTGLWVTWQLTLTVTTSALIMLAAALFRGPTEPRRGAGAAGAGALIALAAAILGVVVWQPRIGWPEWYTFLWTPALFLLALPAPRRVLLVGTAIVAGSAAALVTWGAELDGRIHAAQLDLSHVGNVEDPLARPLLQRFDEQIEAGPEPETASAMYVAWRSSYLAGQDYPVRLALWRPDGTRLDELALDSLDLPAALVSTLVRSLDSTENEQIVSLLRVPGRHYVLLQRMPSGHVLTTSIGPPTRLFPPTRLARLLRPPAEGAPLFELALSPPFTSGLVDVPRARWYRQGWEARSDRLVNLPGGVRHIHATVELRPLPMLLVRGGLLVALDLLVLTVVWILATIGPRQLRRWRELVRLARSFQVRLAVTLALFFVVPAVGFTVWGLGRLDAEADHTRDLLTTAVLRDAVLTAGGLLQEPGDLLSQGMRDLSNRLEADLVLYSGGRLVAASSPILEDLSLVEPLLDAQVFQRLALGDELELTRQATTYVAPVRVGYRVAQAGPPGGIGILATPQLAADWSRKQDQLDLTFVLLLGTVLGVGAAVLGGQLVARALSRPVADLRQSAAALGQGRPMPEVAAPPAEFEQVFGAFARMAEDIRTSQTALEAARRRTALVLANVATGVVALDPEGAVLMANARARQLLGSPLEPGERLATLTGPDWEPLVQQVRDFLAGSGHAAAGEVEVEGRSYRVQLARLGEEPGGAVLAVDDLTDVTQAARVLAWGEMARQVAHEIKNPLTPIRLGVQHLQRVRRERPDQFDQTLTQTAARILAEIDRLDTIARAFSRFGLPGGDPVPLEGVDLGAAAREVAALYHLTGDGTSVEVTEGQTIRRPARVDELKEVLGNLVENARSAGARRVTIRIVPDGLAVRDDGPGIPADQLPRIFEPRFSTTTSGAGLGLPIVRRLVEGWGARVEVESEVGHGTEVSVRW